MSAMEVGMGKQGLVIVASLTPFAFAGKAR